MNTDIKKPTTGLAAGYDSAEFMRTFECKDTLDCTLGAIYSKNQTVFRVWAPVSSKVTLNLYSSGTGGCRTAMHKMQKRVVNGVFGGVWELSLDGDLDGVYYTYTVHNGMTPVETIDPYARACGANGMRGMVIDLVKASPKGWARDKHIYRTAPASADVPIVWEAHVKDFSASPDSGMKYKGKYLAFTEPDTTAPGTEIKTGVAHLKELGVTYVQLNPVYDFATIDESGLSVADDTKDVFNWGYDPQNYNIPEGSYATDPSRGEVRINEFKQMVMALHAAGIGVIMDVVYNHTYSTSGQALGDTVPFYYHRTDREGRFTNLSGCGNDTASERAMMRKYIVESVLYWTSEYHIDGFRFDLMGIHDRETIEAVRAALDSYDNGGGKHILMYGEPWTGEFGGDTVPYSFTARVTNSSAICDKGYAHNDKDNTLVKKLYHAGDLKKLPLRVAVFGDTGRDGLRGNNDPGRGWVNGEPEKNASKVRKMMEGYCGGFNEGLDTAAGSQCVAYASVHDNYTLWDQLVGKQAGKETPLAYAPALPELIKRNELAAAAYLMSSGICVMLAGEEMGRTKYGNHNSYNSPVKLNMIRWSRLKEFTVLFEFYKRLVALRKSRRDLFSYEKAQNPANCYGDFSESDESGKIVFKKADLYIELDPVTLTGRIADIIIG